MKVAVITANIGNVDHCLGMPRQSVEVDYFYYTENTLPYPLSNLDNRLKARYLKSQSHRFLKDYDVHIWVDGRIKIEGNNFVQIFLEQLENHDIVLYNHFDRKTVYEEMEYIIEQMVNGSNYLLSRYGNQQLIKEALFYKEKDLPKEFPLFMGGFFARLNNEKVNRAFDEWWLRQIEFSYSDQTMLSYICWENKIKINQIDFDELRTHKLFTIGKHI